MKTSKLIRALVAGGLVGLASVSSFAAGLGRLTVQSSLGQPLQAEIELLSLQKGELDTLIARIATQEAFQEAKIEYSPALNGVRFSIETKPSGQPYLRVSTVQPINEPFVDMLVEISSTSGRLLREFPLLLDPPGFNPSKPPAIAKSAVVPARPVVTPTPQPAKSATPAASAPLPITEAQPSSSYKVKSGDTLSKIAGQLKSRDVNLDQMLVALFRQNKQAFIGDNMNRLRAKTILRVPSSEQAKAVPESEARREVLAQSGSWASYRGRLANQVAATPAQPQAGAHSSAGKIDKAVVEKPAAPAAAPKDVLKLSKGDKKAPGVDSTAEDKSTALREELVARSNQMKEDKARIAQLEKNIAEMERLLALKNQSMVELQKQAESAKSAQAQTNKSPVDAKPAPEAKTAQPASPAPEAKPAPAPEAKSAAPEAKPAPAQEAKPAPEAKSEPVVPPIESKPATPPKKAAPTPPPEPDFMEGLMENPVYIMGGAGIGLALFGLILFGAYKRRKSDGSTTTGTTSSLASDLRSGTSPNAKSSGVVDTGNSSFLTDFEKTGPGIIDVEEVDPVAEAEVYIAYGRDAQAEEILKEAMAKDSGRHEIPLKLLEIYAARKSVSSFEAVAKQLHDSIGSSHPLWARVVEMGQKLDPSNSLYVIGAAAASTIEPPATTNIEVPVVPSAPEPESPRVSNDGGPTTGELAAHGDDLDFDLDLPSSDAPASIDVSLSSGDAPLDLPLKEEPIHIEEVQPEEVPSEPTLSPTEGSALDFDLGGIELPKPVPDRAEPPAADQTMLARPKFTAQFTDDDLDLSDFGGDQAASASSAASEQPEETPVIDMPTAAKLDTPLPDLSLDIGTPIIPAAVDTAAKRPAPTLELDGLNLDMAPVSFTLDTPSEATIDTHADSDSDVATEIDTGMDANLDSEWHSVATKLDLARAYLEIGDKEGAREILQEVMQEGDTDQKREAEELTANMA